MTYTLITLTSSIRNLELENEINEIMSVPSRKNIIDSINLLRVNKHKINLENMKQYNNLITYLYKEIEKYQIEKKLIIDDKEFINYSDYLVNREKVFTSIYNFYDLITKKDNFLNYLYQDVPIIKLVLQLHKTEENIPKYEVQIEPINKEYVESWVISVLKFLINVVPGKSTNISIALCITIFDFVFRNIKFVTSNIKFAITIKAKLDEFINLNKKVFDDFIDKYINQKDVLEIWCQKLNKINNEINNEINL